MGRVRGWDGVGDGEVTAARYGDGQWMVALVRGCCNKAGRLEEKEGSGRVSAEEEECTPVGGQDARKTRMNVKTSKG